MISGLGSAVHGCSVLRTWEWFSVIVEVVLTIPSNQTTPFWSHPALIRTSNADNGTESSKHEAAHGMDSPEDEGSPNVVAADEYLRHNAARTDFEEAGDRSDDELVDTGRGGWDIEQKTFKEMQARIYQTFAMVSITKSSSRRRGAGFMRLAQNCLSRERRLNSSRAASPTVQRSTFNFESTIRTPNVTSSRIVLCT